MHPLRELGFFQTGELLDLSCNTTALFSVKQEEGSRFFLLDLSQDGSVKNVFEKSLESPWIYLGFFTEKRKFSLITTEKVRLQEQAGEENTESTTPENSKISETLFLSSWEQSSDEPSSFIKVTEKQASPEFRSITHIKTEKIAARWIKTTLFEKGKERVSFFDLERGGFSPFQTLPQYGVPEFSFWNLFIKPLKQEPIPLSYDLLSSTQEKALYIEKGVEFMPSQIFSGSLKVIEVYARIIKKSGNHREVICKIDLPSSAFGGNTFYSYNHPFWIAAHIEKRGLCSEEASLIVSTANLTIGSKRNIKLPLEKGLSKQFSESSIEGSFITDKGLCFLEEHVLVLYNGRTVTIYDLRRDLRESISLDMAFLNSGKIEKVFLIEETLYLSILYPNGSSKAVKVSLENSPV